VQHILGQHVSGAPFRTEFPHGLVRNGEHCEHHNHGYRGGGPPLEETPTTPPTSRELQTALQQADDATESVRQWADRELREDQFRRAAKIFIKQTYDGGLARLTQASPFTALLP
jgi:hypothetical protein